MRLGYTHVAYLTSLNVRSESLDYTNNNPSKWRSFGEASIKKMEPNDVEQSVGG
jgi:hypothetical protein